MSLSRNVLLWISYNDFLKKKLPQFYFVRKAVKRFMPGETLPEAIEAALTLNKKNLGIVFTYLGENLTSLSEAEIVKEHYLNVLNEIHTKNIDAEISIKLTQLGFDIYYDKCMNNLEELAGKAKEINSFVWIDMEGSKYTQSTIDFYNNVSKRFSNTGLCLQAYLLRTLDDILNNINPAASIRLVKGAYKEPPEIAYQKKTDVDKNYFNAAEILLKNSLHSGGRKVFGTHDINLINKIKDIAARLNTPKPEFHMLFGIKTNEQIKLADEGY